MATYTETTLETGVLGTELFAGVVVTTLEVAAVSSSWLERTLFPLTDVAVITSSVTGDLSKTVTEYGTLDDSSTTRRRFAIITTEVARISSQLRSKNIVHAETITEEGALSSELVLTAALRQEITERGALNDLTYLTRRITATLTETGKLTSAVLDKHRFIIEESGELSDGSAVVQKARVAALGSGVLSSEVLSRVIRRGSLESRGSLNDVVHGRRTTRHTLTDRLYGGRNVRTFRP